MSTGLTVESFLNRVGNFVNDDSRFHLITSDKFGSDLLKILRDMGLLKHPMYLWSYDNTVTDITPASVCVVNSRLIDRLHSEV